MDFLSLAFRLPSLPFSILFGLSILYWVGTIVGFFDLDGLDLDFEIGDVSALGKVLDLFGIGRVPSSIWLSFFALSALILSINLNHLADSVIPTWTDSIRLVVFGIPVVIVSSLLARLLSSPFAPLFRGLNRQKVFSIEGKTVHVTSSSVDQSFGIAEFRDGGSPIILDVRSIDEETLVKDDLAVVVRHDKKNNTYYIHKHIT
ncbi:MAG: DUF1449 family protein [Pseudobacteriovorax sp.]|nr:DUF1449 family protein [Pseudobacteriovorax sp.]